MNFITIDFETANPKRNSACAIALAVVKGGQVVKTAWTLIRPPEMNFHSINQRTHGIREEEVLKSPTFDQVWGKIGHIFKKQVVVAHNASFDISVLKYSLDHYELPYPQISYLCTHKCAKAVWPHFSKFSLPYVCYEKKIDLKHHCEDENAKACAQIVLACCKEKNATGLKQLSEIIGIDFGFLGFEEDDECVSDDENTCAKRPDQSEAKIRNLGETKAVEFSELKKKANLLLKEAAFREEESPEKAVELYQESIRLFHSAGEMVNERKIRPVSFPLNRLTLTLEKHGELKKCLFQIDLYEPCLQDGDRNTEYILKRKERILKKLGK